MLVTVRRSSTAARWENALRRRLRWARSDRSLPTQTGLGAESCAPDIGERDEAGVFYAGSRVAVAGLEPARAVTPSGF